MKQVTLSIFTAMGLLILMPAAMASASSTETIIAGTVTDSGSPVDGASVTVTCNGVSENTSTTSAGGYGVQYIPASVCPEGSTATVAATKGSITGSNSGKVLSADDTLNVAIVNVAAVPELGVVGGLGAVVLGGGAMFLIRRHNLGKQSI